MLYKQERLTAAFPPIYLFMRKFLAISAGICCLALVAAASNDDAVRKDRFSRKLNTFNTIVKELQTNYVDTLNAVAIMDRTIDALLYQIDPYTEYYPADNQDEILSISRGQYAGIGSYISKRGDKIIVSEPQWLSPARNAGLRPGDVIVAVNGDTITPSTNVADVSKRLRGSMFTAPMLKIQSCHSTSRAPTSKSIRFPTMACAPMGWAISASQLSTKAVRDMCAKPCSQ